MNDDVVVQVSTTDGTGGAARAARRLHDGLNRIGWESWMAAGLRQVGGPRAVALNDVTRGHKLRVGGWVESALHTFGGPIGERRLPFPSTRAFPKTDLFARASVLHLHNLHGSYFDYAQLPAWARLKPVVWTLHDMWAATGHCAYSFECDRWRTGCHDCPMFGPWRRLDEIRRTPRDNSEPEWRRKRAVYSSTPMTVTAPTRWLQQVAEESILAGHPATTFHQVRYGIDTGAYRPVDRALARTELGLRAQDRVVLFSAAALDNERKGVALLADALAGVRADAADVTLMTMGAPGDLPPALRDARALGGLATPEEQRRAYAAADVVALPTRADNQPLVMLEALACATPVAGFAVGGVPETVRDGITGLLAPADDASALGAAVMRLLDEPESARRMGHEGRAVIERDHELERQAAEHAALYDIARDRAAG